MGIQTHFNRFHDTIKLSRGDDVYKRARDRDDSIKAQIKTAFAHAGYPVTVDFIQGSLKMHTGVMPISGDLDIDRALVIDDDKAPENPVTPKKTVLAVLEDRGFKNAKIKKPCVTADYASDNVHIDLIIYKRSADQTLSLAVGKKTSSKSHREWSACDPYGLIEWVADRSNYPQDDITAVSDQFRRLVRYFKRWRDIQFKTAVASKVFSIGLTVMVKENLVWSFSLEGAKQDLRALRDTASAIQHGGYFHPAADGKYRVRVALPTAPWRDIFHGSSLDTGTQLYNKLTHLVEQLDKAAAETNEYEQCVILNGLFGDDFAVPSVPSDDSSSAKAIYPTPGVVRTSQGA